MKNRFLNLPNMVKTGISIPDALSILAILLPLIPILIISLRRAWFQDTMIFLGMICLLSFMHHLMVYIPRLVTSNTLFINSVFGLSEFALLLYLFKQVIQAYWVKQAIHTVLISFSSIAITTYALRGIESYASPLATASALIILPVAILALLQLIRERQLFIFQSPLFWIAGGNICYYSMFILTGLVAGKGGSMATQQEKVILLSVINSIRFLFFIVAACAAEKKEEKLTVRY